MLRPILAAVLLAALSACSDRPRALAEPDGPVFRLNPDRWVESAAARPGVGRLR
jgi:hypothetical protein